MQSKAEYKAEILLGVFVEGLLAKLRSIVIEQHLSFESGFKEGLIGHSYLVNPNTTCVKWC